MTNRGAAIGGGTYPRHYESIGVVRTSAARLFAHLDDHARLASHMSKSSWMMAGGRMDLEWDEARGQQVGSRIRLAGSVLGINLAVDETVIERDPPRRKVWETTGVPIVGHWSLPDEIRSHPDGRCSATSGLHRLLAANEVAFALAGVPLRRLLRQVVYGTHGR